MIEIQHQTFLHFDKCFTEDKHNSLFYLQNDTVR